MVLHSEDDDNDKLRDPVSSMPEGQLVGAGMPSVSGVIIADSWNVMQVQAPTIVRSLSEDRLKTLTHIYWHVSDVEGPCW